MKRHGNTRQRGSTMVMVTTIGVIVSILGMAMVHLGYQARVMAVRNVQGIAARAAADAGMVEAIFKMQKKLRDEAVWDNDSLPSATNSALAGTNSTFSSTIAGNLGNGWQIDSTGVCGPKRKTTHTKLDIGTYWKGISLENLLDVKLGTSFDVINGDDKITIRTNSTMANSLGFKAFVTVTGDVICGPGGNIEAVIDAKASTNIQGQTYAADELLDFPDVLPPLGTMVVSTPITTTTTIARGAWQYDTIDLSHGAILSIESPMTVLYVTGTTTLGNSTEIAVKPGASLELYLGGNLVNQNSTGIINETGIAANLKIYGLPGCVQMDLKAKSDLYAAVYAPSATINLFNSGDFYGAIAADSFNMQNSGNFTFDVSLMSTIIDDAAAVFENVRWWED